jgi:hypothetical protein
MKYGCDSKVVINPLIRFSAPERQLKAPTDRSKELMTNASDNTFEPAACTMARMSRCQSCDALIPTSHIMN